MKEVVRGYGVLIRRKDGSSFLASGAEVAPYLVRNFDGAQRYKRELIEHLNHKRMRVVKVRATFEVGK